MKEQIENEHCASLITDPRESVGTTRLTKTVTRREFFSYAGRTSAVILTAGTIGLPILGTVDAVAEAAEVGPLTARKRRRRAFQIRLQAAKYQRNLPLPEHPTNGDEERYVSRIGSYSKGLSHNDLGEVDLDAYDTLLQAMASGVPGDFEAIPLGGTAKLANPQAALAFQLEGADSHHLGTAAPPTFESEEQGGEMAEIYWHALARDVPFSQYGAEPITAAAVSDLAQFSNFTGVDAGNLFRGTTLGDLIGPYISQFLWKPIPYGPIRIVQKYNTPIPGDDHMIDPGECLGVQRGFKPSATSSIDPTPSYLRNARDLGEWVHRDFTYQGFLNAALILLSFGPDAVADSNPYKNLKVQAGFVTLGPADLLTMIAKVTDYAFRAVMYQKWSLHRRLRPEKFGLRVHNHLTQTAAYPIHDKLLNSVAVAQVVDWYGFFTLPMAYPEGCPTHPSYPAAHAAIAGACVTVLKAFFKEDLVVPSPQVASDDGLSLIDYQEEVLTVGGELNKLASNIAIGRDLAGVHWRSDGIEGLRLGEAVAIRALKDLKGTYNEDFSGFTLTKFDGTVIRI
ncbi:MAG: phosphoesterase [Gammaproteobacteria bacterium]